MKKNNYQRNQIILGDALNVMKGFPGNSVDVVLTDPPYFLDKLDNNWEYDKVNNEKNQQLVKSLPSGMKFDRKQGENFYNWYYQISKELLRVLKPGGYFFSFSSPRLYHRMACAVDDAGFLIRDCFLWIYTQNQAKAMSLNHFIDKLDMDEQQKENIKHDFNGWKTPQIKSCYEPIIMAQKATDGTFLSNMLKYKIGLLNTQVRVGANMFPANILSLGDMNGMIDKYFLIAKPSKKEKGEYNNHKTVKPIALCEHILKLCAYYKHALVLDPFVGSGTTAVAAQNLGLNYIGIDTSKEYTEIAQRRLKEAQMNKKLL
ncbi:MAG: site-specific DNA-methyltransferase [Parcubacteria group bacterium]